MTPISVRIITFVCPEPPSNIGLKETVTKKKQERNRKKKNLFWQFINKVLNLLSVKINKTSKPTIKKTIINKINKSMKTTFLKISALASVVLLIFAATSISSCKKDQTCRGYVNVYDSASNKVPLATVRLDAYTINGDITYTEKTDGNGLATFDIALPAIFDIYVTKEDDFPLMWGKGSLNVDEPRKEGWATVAINQQ